MLASSRIAFYSCIGQVKVRKFTHKEGSAGNSAYDYAYSLWLPITGHVQTVRKQATALLLS